MNELGARREILYSGSEINCEYMAEIAESFNLRVGKKILVAPKMMLNSFPSVRGADGNHMTYLNRLPLNSTVQDIELQVDSISDWTIAEEWLKIFGQSAAAKAMRKAEGLTDENRSQFVDVISKGLEPFRAGQKTNGQVLKAMKSGTATARSTLQKTLSVMRESLGIRSYLASARTQGQSKK